MASAPLDRALKQALKDLADWRRWSRNVSEFEASLSLDDVIRDAVEYGYQAATMDMDARKRGIKCSHISTKGRSQT